MSLVDIWAEETASAKAPRQMCSKNSNGILAGVMSLDVNLQNFTLAGKGRRYVENRSGCRDGREKSPVGTYSMHTELWRCCKVEQMYIRT